MLTQVENKNGIISFDDSIVTQIVNEAMGKYINDCKLINKSSTIEAEGVILKLNFKLKFGTSIKDFSNNIIKTICDKFENQLELPIKQISIYISAIYSKKVSKRNILIEYNNQSEIKYYGY